MSSYYTELLIIIHNKDLNINLNNFIKILVIQLHKTQLPPKQTVKCWKLFLVLSNGR
jgi:hypothetical protein